MEHCEEHLPPFEARRNSPVGGSVQEKDVNDIMFAVKEMDRRDTSETTVFVATRLDGLPKVTPGEVDPISLLERVTLLETSMRNVQQCVTRHDSALAAVTRTATRNSHNTSASSAVETMAPTSRTDATYDHGACDTSASSAVETMAPTSRTDAAHDHGAYDTSASPAIETMANASPTDATTKPSWSTVAASRDKFVVPKYHEKKQRVNSQPHYCRQNVKNRQFSTERKVAMPLRVLLDD